MTREDRERTCDASERLVGLIQRLRAVGAILARAGRGEDRLPATRPPGAQIISDDLPEARLVYRSLGAAQRGDLNPAVT